MSLMNVELVAKDNKPVHFKDVKILGVFKWDNDGYCIKICDDESCVSYNTICLTGKCANQGFILIGTDVAKPVKSKLMIYEEE